MPTIDATIDNLMRPLENSTSDLMLTNLPSPLIGEILSSFGVNESELKTKPLTANFAPTPKAISSNIVGPTPKESSNNISRKTFPILAASTRISWKFCNSPLLTAEIFVAKKGPRNPAMRAPPTMMAT